MTTTDPGTGNASPSCGACVCASAAPAASVPARRHLSLLPVLLVVLLPKCPLCVAAYLGIAGSIAAGSWLPAACGVPLCAALLAAVLGALLLSMRRSRDVRPLLAGLAGAAALLGGKFAVDSSILLYAGAALVAVASVWSAHLAARHVPGTCPARAGSDARDEASLTAEPR